MAGRTPTGYLPDLFTDNFWDEVDSITMSILSLLLPLINVLGKLSPGAGWPPLTRVHQELHDIVAEAGWFTNGMRVSKSVFWVQFPNPGDLWDVDQEHVTEIIWNKSKAAATSQDREVAAGWKADLQNSWREVSEGQAMNRQWRREYEKIYPPPKEPRRAAKVQIVMWPWIKQYSPVRPKSDGDLNSGELITRIVKAQIVYYAGDDSDEGEMRERLTLEEHMRAATRTKSRDWAIWLLFWVLFLLLMYAAFGRQYHQVAGSHNLREILPRPFRPAPEQVTEIRVADVTVEVPPVGTKTSIRTITTTLLIL